MFFKSTKYRGESIIYDELDLELNMFLVL